MEIFRESNKYSCFYDLFKKRTLACHLLNMVAKMESLILNQYCLKVKCHLTFCRTSYETEDPFVVKVVFVSNRICLAQNFECVFTRRKSHQSKIFDSFQFYPQFVQIDMASFQLSLRIIQP
jgi:hypothetical protein